MTSSPKEEMIAAGRRIYAAIPQLGTLRENVLFGDVWLQPELSVRDRSLVTCAILAATGRDDELAIHVERAVENGVTVTELRGLATQLAMYSGWPSAMAFGKAALPLVESERQTD